MNSLNTKPQVINRRPSTLAATALEVSRTQLGVKEQYVGCNDGPEIREYLKAVGLPPGYPWCAAFVYWCHVRAGKNAMLSIPLPCTGGVLAMFNTAKGKHIQKLDAHDAPISPDALRPGDIFIIQFPNGHAQTGIIEKITSDCIITIEGNTDANGGREGIGVFSKRRKVSGLRGIIRIVE